MQIWGEKANKLFQLVWMISKSFTITYNICMHNPVRTSLWNMQTYLQDTFSEVGINIRNFDIYYQIVPEEWNQYRLSNDST